MEYFQSETAISIPDDTKRELESKWSEFKAMALRVETYGWLCCAILASIFCPKTYGIYMRQRLKITIISFLYIHYYPLNQIPFPCPAILKSGISTFI